VLDQITDVGAEGVRDLEDLDEVEPALSALVFETNDCGRPSASASWDWVSPLP
jgi:hypothetical protein